jgi:hypothetical protein
MPSRATRFVLLLAILFSGALAGGNIDRAFVAMPAWQQIGAMAWADFSRHADLDNGLILYPAEAIGAALLSLIAAIRFHFDKTVPRQVVLPAYVAVLLAAGGLVLTLKAAPIMLGIRDSRDPALLRTAFEGFWYWGNIRAACQISAFLALLATLPIVWRARS